MLSILDIPYGLYIVTTNATKMNGCITNTVIQVTSNPEKISVALNKETYTFKEIQKSKEFNVSIIDETAPLELIKRFGFITGKIANKFDDFSDYKISTNNIPYIINHTNGYLSAKVVNEVDLGSHIMFIAEVTEDNILSFTKTMTYSYYKENLKPSPKTKQQNYVCSVCGYLFKDEENLKDVVCPLCKVENMLDKIKEKEEKGEKQDGTEKQNEQTESVESTNKNVKKAVCPVCGYVYEGDNPPEFCPICSVKMEIQED